MLNNIFPLTVQAAVTTPGQTPIVPTFGSAATWIDDAIRLSALGY